MENKKFPSTILEVNTTYHNNLLGKNEENQHEISSITGLQDIIDLNNNKFNSIDAELTKLDEDIKNKISIKYIEESEELKINIQED